MRKTLQELKKSQITWKWILKQLFQSFPRKFQTN
jgi:predicted metal-dependent peptidase